MFNTISANPSVQTYRAAAQPAQPKPEPQDRLTSAANDCGCPTLKDLENLVKGAGGAAVGAAILSVGSATSALCHIPQGVGQIWNDIAGRDIQTCDEAVMAALSSVMLIPLLLSPVTGALVGATMGALHGAIEGNSHGVMSAVKATCDDIPVVDKMNDEFDWRCQ